MFSPYNYIKSFHVRTLSFGVFLALAFYYAVVAFHWQYLATWVRLTGPVVGYTVLIAFTGIVKGVMAIRIYSLQRSGVKALNAVILVSFYLAAALGVLGLALWLAHWLQSLFSTTYWAKAHWFWVSSLLLIAFVLLGYVIHRKKLVSWSMLQDLKAVPIVSPVFCFGAPVVWSNNLAYASLPKETLATYSSLSIVSGVIFLLYWIAYAIGNQKFGEIHSKGELSPAVELLSAKGTPLPARTRPSPEVATWVCLGIFTVALWLFSVVLVDIVLRIGFS